MNGQENKENVENEFLTTKNKRDQYLIEIRKNKTGEMITRKRIKMAFAMDNPATVQTNQNIRDIVAANNANIANIEENSESTNKPLITPPQSFSDLAEKFFEAINNQNSTEVFNIVQTIRHRLSNNNNPPLDELFATGLPVHIFKFLDSCYDGRPDIQYEALWILTNCLAGTAKQSDKILTEPILRRIIELLGHPKPDIVEIIFWILANLAGDSKERRQVLFEFKIIDEVNKYMKTRVNHSEFIIRNVSWFLSNLAQSFDHAKEFVPLLPLIQLFFEQKDAEISSNAAYALSYITGSSDDKFTQSISTNALVRRATELLDSPDVALKIPSIRIIGNILSCNSGNTFSLFGHDLLPKFEDLITYRKPTVRRESIWVLSNILAENENVIARVLETGIFVKLLSTLTLDLDDIKGEALICFMNTMSSCSLEQADQIVRLGLVRMLKPVLTSDNVKVVLASIECLEAVLNKGKLTQKDEHLDRNPFLYDLESENMMPLIENLQHHASEEVYVKVSALIDKYLETVGTL